MNVGANSSVMRICRYDKRTIFYPIRWIFFDVAESLGLPIGVRIHVMFDVKSEVYIATSKNVKGLVVEAETFEQLISEINDLIPILIKQKPKTKFFTDYHLTSQLIPIWMDLRS